MESLYLYPRPRFLDTLKHPLTLGTSPFKSKSRTPSSVQVWVLFPCLLKVFSFSDKQNLKLNCREITTWFPFPTLPFSGSSLVCSFAAPLTMTEQCQCLPTGKALLISCATPCDYFLETKSCQLCEMCAPGEPPFHQTAS